MLPPFCAIVLAAFLKMRTRAQVDAWREISTNYRQLQIAISESMKSSEQEMNNCVTPHDLATPPRKRMRIMTMDPFSTKRGALQEQPTCKSINQDIFCLQNEPINDILTPAIVLERLVCPSKENIRPIVGRTQERGVIEKIISRSDTSSTSPIHSLFVVGPPGTGKSSCVSHVTKESILVQNNAGIRSVLIHLNCNAYASPLLLYNTIRERIIEAIPIKQRQKCRHRATIDSDEVHTFLRKIFQMSTKFPHITIVLDEVDRLMQMPVTTQFSVQQLLKFLLQWGELPQSTFRFIGILNGMDMHTRISDLLKTYNSTKSTQVLLFPSYTYPELVHILETYVLDAYQIENNTNNPEVIEPRTIELIARKIAARDGDARQAIGLLQQCARTCLQQNRDKLTVRDVLECTSRVLSSHTNLVKQIHQLPRQSKILLYTITKLAPNGTIYTDLDAVVMELSRLQVEHNLVWLPQFRHSELHSLLSPLDCYAFIKRHEMRKKTLLIASTITMETIEKAFKQDELLCLLPTI